MIKIELNQKEKEEFNTNLNDLQTNNNEINNKYNFEIREKNKYKEMNKKYEKYIQDLNEKMIKNQEEISKYKMKIEKINLENKLNQENNKRYNDALDKYENIIKEERNKVKNAYSIISRLRAELDYIKDENLKLLKMISENNRKEYKLLNFNENKFKEENEDINIQNEKETINEDNNINNLLNNKKQKINVEDISFRNEEKEKKNLSSELIDNGNVLNKKDCNCNCNEKEYNTINKTYEMNININQKDNGINNKKYIKYEEIMNINNNEKDELYNDNECFNNDDSNGENNF